MASSAILAHDVTAPKGHDADLVEWSRTDVPASAMGHDALGIELFRCGNDLAQAYGGAAR